MKMCFEMWIETSKVRSPRLWATSNCLLCARGLTVSTHWDAKDEEVYPTRVRPVRLRSRSWCLWLLRGGVRGIYLGWWGRGCRGQTSGPPSPPLPPAWGAALPSWSQEGCSPPELRGRGRGEWPLDSAAPELLPQKKSSRFNPCGLTKLWFRSAEHQALSAWPRRGRRLPARARPQARHPGSLCIPATRQPGQRFVLGPVACGGLHAGGLSPDEEDPRCLTGPCRRRYEGRDRITLRCADLNPCLPNVSPRVGAAGCRQRAPAAACCM